MNIDNAFFLGGMSKDQVLKAFKAHIFFDDQDVHVGPASQLVPSCLVPYKSSSHLPNNLKDVHILRKTKADALYDLTSLSSLQSRRD